MQHSHSHLKAKGRKLKYYDSGKYFCNRTTELKVYDAAKNLKKKVSLKGRDDLATTSGYKKDANYVKVELRFKKPAITFKQRTITVTDLLTSVVYDQCRQMLLEEYSKIEKMKSINITSKKQLFGSLMYLLSAIAMGEFAQMDAQEYILDLIITHSDFLSIYDIRKKKAKVKNDFAKLQVGDSKYDLCELLRAEMYPAAGGTL